MNERKLTIDKNYGTGNAEPADIMTVTADEMRMIEKMADAGGLPYRQMMENAGTNAYKIIKSVMPNPDNVIIFAGKGNNGGDGFVSARHFMNDNVNVTVILCEGEPVTVDALYNYDLIKAGNVKITTVRDCLNEIGCSSSEIAALPDEAMEKLVGNGEIAALPDEAMEKLAGSGETVVIDAVYGIGFHGVLRESGKAAASLINRLGEAGCEIFAYDIPSGVNADTGEVSEGAVKADTTIAFHALKPAHVIESSDACCGITVIAEIGIR